MQEQSTYMELIKMDLIHRIVNAETGEIVEKSYTDKELKEVQENKERINKELAKLETINAKRQLLLNKIGLTEDEAKLLLG